MRKKQFKAESRRLLDMMINSIYTHKEIFLREIISNASDAIDKLCYVALTDPSVGMKRGDFEIMVSLDKENRNITVSDNGIGMNEQDLEQNLGIIAFSGSKKFKEEMAKGETVPAENSENSSAPDIIGQFGVGFYSAFMVADHITVVTKKHGEDQAFRWDSDGVDGYTIEPFAREKTGTDIIMHISPDGEEEDEFTRYLDEYTISGLVKKYSDYVRFPIKMLMSKSRLKDGCPEDKPEYEEFYEYETLNSMVPLWHRRKSDVTQDEYDKFYMDQFFDMEKPQSTISVHAEGSVSYDALLFIPGKTPGEYYTDSFKAGLQLYSSGVMIMDHCEDLLPDYFNFVRGVVESPDLSLNISREMLQHDRQLKMIGSHLEKKVRGELDKMMKDDREGYEKFYRNFGRQLKMCALDNYGAQKEKLQDLLMFWSSTEKKPVKLDEYVERMKEDQKYIYFATGTDETAIDRMPQTEVLKDHGYEILYFTDQMDEFIADMFYAYKDKPFRSAIAGDLGLESEKTAEKAAEEHKEALDFIKETLGDLADEIKASDKLKSHPVCLSPGEGVTFEMERYFKAVQPDMPIKAKRILEINVDHPAFAALEEARTKDPEKARKYCRILYNQAMLIAGMPLEDPSEYTDLLVSLW